MRRLLPIELTGPIFGVKTVKATSAEKRLVTKRSFPLYISLCRGLKNWYAFILLYVILIPYFGVFSTKYQIIGEDSKLGLTSGHLTTAVQIRFNHSMYVTFYLLFSSVKGSHWTSVNTGRERGGGGWHTDQLDFWSVMKCETIGNEYDLLPDVGSLCCLSISFNWKRVIFPQFSQLRAVRSSRGPCITQAGSFLRAEY